MQPEAYAMLAARQATYWWHRARRNMAVALLRRAGLGVGCRVLDLGCGPGGNLSMLDSFRPNLIVGVDISEIAIELARHNAPDARIVRADLNCSLPFANSTADVITIFNVLYHGWIANEGAVLREAARALRPGGLILVTEPAFTILAREMDDAGMARRRYRRRDLTEIFRRAGFNVKYAGYFTSFGFPLLLAMRLFRRVPSTRRPINPSLAPDMKPMSPVFNELAYLAAAI